MKPDYIIIRGPLGIGKTTIAEKLAKKLKGEYISIDLVLEKLELDHIEGRGIPVRNFLKVNENIMPKLKETLSSGKLVVIDGNFYHKEQIEDLIKKLNFKHYVFNLKASLETCIKRDDNRKKVYGEQAVKDVYKLVSTFDYGVSINTENKTENEVVDEILRRIK